MDDYSFDLHRIIVGDLPLMFYGEILLRTSVLFLFTLILVRTMGKRSLGQLSAFDFVIIIALGSAVGDPMFYVDVPLLYGMVVVATVVGMERVLARLTARRRRVERFVDSTATVVVRNGVIDHMALHREFISRSELCQSLRSQGVARLADVAMAVLEPSGNISVLSADADMTDALWEFERAAASSSTS